MAARECGAEIIKRDDFAKFQLPDEGIHFGWAGDDHGAALSFRIAWRTARNHMNDMRHASAIQVINR
jgi:hypothetical protein